MSMSRESQNFSDDLTSFTPDSLSVLDLPLDSLCTPILGTGNFCKPERTFRSATTVTITPKSSVSDFSDFSPHDDETTVEQKHMTPPATPCPLAMNLCLNGREKFASHRFLDVDHVYEVGSLIRSARVDTTVVQLASRLMDRFRTVDIISEIRACLFNRTQEFNLKSEDYLSEVLFVVCLHLSHKFLEDLPHTIASWLKYSGLYTISTRQFVAVEQLLLSTIDYDLFSIWRQECLGIEGN